MARTDEERKIRLRPPKARSPRDERVAWSSGFKLLMHYARSTRKARNRDTYAGKGRSAPSYLAFDRWSIRANAGKRPQEQLAGSFPFLCAR